MTIEDIEREAAAIAHRHESAQARRDLESFLDQQAENVREEEAAQDMEDKYGNGCPADADPTVRVSEIG